MLGLPSNQDVAKQIMADFAANEVVRNRYDGSVEAVLAGPEEAVRSMLAACREGPRQAEVEAVDVDESSEPAPPGFRVLPTL